MALSETDNCILKFQNLEFFWHVIYHEQLIGSYVESDSSIEANNSTESDSTCYSKSLSEAAL